MKLHIRLEILDVVTRLDSKSFDPALDAKFGGIYGEPGSAFVTEAGEARRGGRVSAAGVQRGLRAARAEVPAALPGQAAARRRAGAATFLCATKIME